MVEGASIAETVMTTSRAGHQRIIAAAIAARLPATAQWENLHEREPMEEMTNPGKGWPKKHRTQDNYDGDETSNKTATKPEGESLTRQEFKSDTDINILLARFGVDQPQRQMQWGAEVDYNMDLQQAYAAVAQAQGIMAHVPQELREKYRNSAQVLGAIESGEYERDLAELQKTRSEKTAQEQREKRRAEIERDNSIRLDIEAERAAQITRSAPPKQTPNE